MFESFSYKSERCEFRDASLEKTNGGTERVVVGLRAVTESCVAREAPCTVFGSIVACECTALAVTGCFVNCQLKMVKVADLEC